MAAHAMLLACVLVYAPSAVGLVGRPGSPPRFFWQVLYARWPMCVTGETLERRRQSLVRVAKPVAREGGPTATRDENQL